MSQSTSRSHTSLLTSLPKRLALVSLCVVVFGCSVGLFATQVKSTQQHSCNNKHTIPYDFPLARPPLPTRPPTKPDWIRRRKRPFMKGISLGMYFQDQTFDYDEFLYDIKRLGASHVGFVISWYQKDVRSTKIERHPAKTVSDARLITTILQARARGLRVFLLPIVRLKERGPDDWRGVIKPTQLDAWWRSYRSYILHYVQIARNHGVELFSVGSELVSMEAHQDRWLRLIRNIRRLFPGPLVYSANWDHYEPVTFWHALDYIGISNYYELSKKELPPLATLRNRWMSIRKKIESWKKKYPHQQLMFTEVGYYSQRGTNIYPWDYTRDQTISLEEQRRCYRAFIDTWEPSPVLGGTFFWNWFSRGGPKDKGYTPRGKPAECELRSWFRKKARAEARQPVSRWLRDWYPPLKRPSRTAPPATKRPQARPTPTRTRTQPKQPTPKAQQRSQP